MQKHRPLVPLEKKNANMKSNKTLQDSKNQIQGTKMRIQTPTISAPDSPVTVSLKLPMSNTNGGMKRNIVIQSLQRNSFQSNDE